MRTPTAPRHPRPKRDPMSDLERILQTIYSAVDEINEQLPEGKTLDKSPDTVLFGNSGKLDSLGLVSLIVTVEQSIQEGFGAEITLADERALSQRNSPFRTISTLSEYISLLLAEKETDGD
jgi:D-alanine--poly(phosphoribitol) ligase subunit 2